MSHDKSGIKVTDVLPGIWGLVLGRVSGFQLITLSRLALGPYTLLVTRFRESFSIHEVAGACR